MIDYQKERNLDRMLRIETAFPSFNALLKARGNYRPTLEMSSRRRYLLAEAYDEAMAEMDDERRAYRYCNDGMLQMEIMRGHIDATKYAQMHGWNKPANPVELAKAFKAMSKRVMFEYKTAIRKAGDWGHLVHRGVEVLGLDADGERTEDIEYLEMSWISGKRFKQAAQYMMDNPDVKSIYFGGGLDQYDPFPEYMAQQREGYADYAPGVEYWGITVPVEMFKEAI